MRGKYQISKKCEVAFYQISNFLEAKIVRAFLTAAWPHQRLMSLSVTNVLWLAQTSKDIISDQNEWSLAEISERARPFMDHQE